MCAGNGAAGGPVHKDVGSSPSANRNINSINITLQSGRRTFSLEERVHLMAAGQEKKKKSPDRFTWHRLRCAFLHMDEGARKVM